MTFNFELVYEFFARKIMESPMPNGGFPPMLFGVSVVDGTVKDIIPIDVRELFVAETQGKDILGALLSTLLQSAAPDACFVLITEAWIRSVTLTDKQSFAEERKKLPTSLENDPLAEEVLMIHIHRPEGSRIGNLRLLPGPKLEYRPLTPAFAWAEGRLVPNAAPPGTTKH